jgi:RNA polymerase sigma-70 factor (ECF subfamily)
MMNKEKDFARIMEIYCDKIFRLCFNYTRNDEDRMDLFHDVLVRIWDRMDSFQERSSLGTWIFRLAVNSGIDFVRKQKVRHRIVTPSDEGNFITGRVTSNVEENMALTEETEFLYQCLDRLPLVEKTIISLYFEDLSYEEIAKIIGISENHVGVKIHRIKKRLEVFFQEFDR